MNPSASSQPDSPDLPHLPKTPVWPLPDRARSALKILALPFNYKVCAGCESIVGTGVAHCPNCHSYRFDTSPDRVSGQALVLAKRPQQSVTAADLLN